MRILLFSSTYPPNTGGVETVTARLAQGLGRRGHEVLVLTNRFPRSLATSERIDGIPVVRRLYPNLVPSPGRRPLMALLKQTLSIPLALYELMSLFRLLRRSRPDVVNIHYLSYPAIYALLAAKLAGVPSVLSFHGSDVPSCPYPATYRWVGRIAGRMATKLTCNSRDLAGFLRQDLRLEDQDKLSVCHFGVDLPAASELTVSTAPDRPFVLVAARLVEKKGVDIAIRAMHQLVDADKASDLHMIIAGSGPLESELKRLAQTPAIGDRIQFVGSLGRDRLTAMLRRCLFLVVPSEWEAFGMIALEAMAVKRAVIASNSGGISEIVVDKETGTLVPPGDAAALAGAMNDLIAHPDRAEEMGRAGHLRAHTHFLWDRAIDEYEILFRSVQ